MNSSCRTAVITLKLLDLYPHCWALVEYMWGYVIPVLAALIIIINGIIVRVFARPHIWSHTTLILTLIACSDTLNIVFPTISYIYHYTSGRFKEYLSYSSCFWTYILADVFVEMFNMISLWLTVLLAYVRCRCLRSPFKARHIHSYKNISKYVTAILLLAVLVHIPSFFLFEFSPVVVEDNTNSTRVVCGISESCIALLKPFMGRKIHMLMETLIDSIVPCVILLCCNVSILITLHKAKRERSSLRRKCSTFKDARNFRDKEVDYSSVDDDEEDIFKEVTEIEIKKSKNGDGFTSVYRFSEIPCKYGINDEINKEKQDTTLFESIQKGRSGFRKKVSADSGIDKLDRESRRTTWLIFVIASMILLHEIPKVVANINNLVIHAEDPLPLNFYGCFSMFLSVWQYITYPVIFIIYAFMSGSFRTELTYTLTSCCKRRNTFTIDTKKVLTSPCFVRKSLSRERSLYKQTV